MRGGLLAALIICLPSNALAQPIIGVASVIDGDTIEVHDQRIRLHGIDAPESSQVCVDGAGVEYRCGQKAAFALDDFLKVSRPVTCVQTDVDRYRRVIARCQSGGRDVAEWMVENGHALDWHRYSKGEYAAAERAARAGKRGMWQGLFARPWEWRRDRNAPYVGG